MPRKRKDPDETGIAKPDSEAPSDESAPKKSARSPSARAQAGPVRKPPSRRNKPAAAPEPEGYSQTQISPVRPEPVQAAQPETAVPPPALSNEAAPSVGVSLQEQIAQLAYSYWEARGCLPGNPDEDWLRAEQEILRRLKKKNGKP